MKMKQLNDRTLKISISMNDLEERGMELADFLVPQEKTEEFFYTILDEFDLPENFLDTGMLSFRVTPKPDKLDVFVTKSEVNQAIDFEDIDLENLPDMEDLSPEEFFKAMESALKEYGNDPEAEGLLSELDTFHQQIDEEERAEADSEVLEEESGKQAQFIYYVMQFPDFHQVRQYADVVDFEYDGSELYKYKGHYYLTILVDTTGFEPNDPIYLMARMREMAQESNVSRSVLQEHGTLLLYGTAIEDLQRI